MGFESGSLSFHAFYLSKGFEPGDIERFAARPLPPIKTLVGDQPLHGWAGPLHALLVRVNDIESEADTIYTEAIHSLFGSSIDYKTLLGAKTVYEGLEHCCDLCEHAADVIEQIVIKNT